MKLIVLWENLIIILTGLFLGITLSILSFWAFAEWANAQTYNFYFNGNEPPAAATPLKPQATTPAQEEKETQDLTPSKEEKRPTQDADALRSNSAHRRMFRGSLLAHSLVFGDRTQTGGTAALSFLPLRHFGFSVFGGTGSEGKAFYGLEAEILPLHMEVFELPRFVEAGFLIGGSNLMRHQSSPGTLHGGVKVGLNFGSRYGIVANARTNLTFRRQERLTMLDAGFVIRF